MNEQAGSTGHARPHLIAPRSTARGWRALQWVVTGFFVLDAALTVKQAPLFGVDQVAVQLLVQFACVALSWRPRMGVWVAAFALCLCLVVPPSSADLWLLGIAPVVLFPLLRHWSGLVIVDAVLLCYSVAVALRFHPDGTVVAEVVYRVVVISVGTVAGLAARWFLTQHHRGRARIVQLEEENRRIRVDERTSLARELHDVVAHQLSITSLQIMGHAASDDLDELRAAMQRIDDATRAALGELRVMVGVLRDGTPIGTGDISHLGDQTVPTAAVRSFARSLAEAGFTSEFTMPDDVDLLDLSEQRTVTRVLQEATTNILRYAPDGGHCTYSVITSPRLIEISVTSPMPSAGMPQRLAGQSLGYGLRGVRERVDLTGGTLTAGRVGPNWVLAMHLPRAGAAV